MSIYGLPADKGIYNFRYFLHHAPDLHSAEGRSREPFMISLCGKYKPVTSPCRGVYTGTIIPPEDFELSKYTGVFLC